MTGPDDPTPPDSEPTEEDPEDIVDLDDESSWFV